MGDSGPAGLDEKIPLPVKILFRGVGQVFFQGNAVTGLMFVLGIAVSSLPMAVGAVIGSAIGAGVAWALKFDREELEAGIFGFNPALVGIASFFFFTPGLITVGLMLVGCVVATFLTRVMRLYVPFPTYTSAFIVTTWGVFFLGQAIGLDRVTGYKPLLPEVPLGFYVEAASHGVSQVMFQASLWTALFFLVGIAFSDRAHALLVLSGSIMGMLVALYHFTLGADSIDPERLVSRPAFDNVKLGLYGFNATLAPVALYLNRKSLVVPLLGMILAVPLTELVPMLGLPALTAPFVLSVWIIMAMAWLERTWLRKTAEDAASEPN